jgi:hypothetical protein
MKHRYIATLITALGLTGCTVYTPLQPALPTIRQAGQVELRAAIQPSLRGEASVAYSPIKHVVLTAAGSWRPQLSVYDTSLYKARRSEVGIGTYWPLNSVWTLSALGGYGWGRTNLRLSEVGIIWNFSTNYFARYQTRFGQFSLSRQLYPFTASFGYRLTRVTFQELRTRDYDLPLDPQWRHEPFLSLRVDLGADKTTTRWQTELSGAVSLPQSGGVNPQNGYNPVAFRAGLNRRASLLVGVGVLYRIPGKAKRL